MKIKFEKGKFLNIILFLIYALIYFITLNLYDMGNPNSRIRYYILAFIVFVGGFTILINKKNKKMKFYNKNLLLSLVIGGIYLFFSFKSAMVSSMSLDFRTIVQILLIVLPSLYAFIFVNNFSMRTIVSIMKISLIITIMIYFCEPKHTLLSFLNISNWLKMDLLNSITFTESSLCSETFTQLFFFFFIFKNLNFEENERNSLKKYSTISLIFVILSFKRFSVVFSLLLFFVGKFINIKKNLSKKGVIILSLLFTSFTYFYFKFMCGELLPNVDVFRFTSGRDYNLYLWSTKGFFSYGYGTSMLVIGRYLEMDLIQIYLELNLFCVFIYCFYLFNSSKKNLYSLFIMIYECLNLLFASTLPTSFPWIILMTTVACLNDTKLLDEKLKCIEG